MLIDNVQYVEVNIILLLDNCRREGGLPKTYLLIMKADFKHKDYNKYYTEWMHWMFNLQTTVILQHGKNQHLEYLRLEHLEGLTTN